eukprot:scaffold218219_cov55-Attheya_sp.AAC.4
METRNMATLSSNVEEDAQATSTIIGRPIYPVEEEPLMGPILRRKKVVSMPLGAGGDFFVTNADPSSPHQQLLHHPYASGGGPATTSAATTTSGLMNRRTKQVSLGHVPVREITSSTLIRQATPPTNNRNRQDSGGNRMPMIHPQAQAQHFMRGVLRRKQVSLDLLGPNDFFAIPTEDDDDEEEKMEQDTTTTTIPLPTTPEDGFFEEEPGATTTTTTMMGAAPEEVKLFRPLRFSPRLVLRDNGTTPNQHTARTIGEEKEDAAVPLGTMDEETVAAFHRYSLKNEELKLQLSALTNQLSELNDNDDDDHNNDTNNSMDKRRQAGLLQTSLRIHETQATMEADETFMKHRLSLIQEEEETPFDDEQDGGDAAATSATTAEGPVATNGNGNGSTSIKEEKVEEVRLENKEDDGIIRATKRDKYMTALCFFIMLGLTILVAVWETHPDEESFIFLPVGLACVTDCPGNLETRDFFHGHSSFHKGEIIDLIMHLDANELGEESRAIVQIIGNETGAVKATRKFGPPDAELRISIDKRITVDFADPGEEHIINISTEDTSVELSFTLSAKVLTPLAANSVEKRRVFTKSCSIWNGPLSACYLA